MAIIYGLYDPRKPIELENCRYIGQTVSPLSEHLVDHLSSAKTLKNAGRDRWIRALLADGVIPTIAAIEEIANDLTHEVEWDWIKRGFAEGWDLTNEGTGRAPLRSDTWIQHLTPDKIAAFWAKVDIRSDDECWKWTAYTNASGYGMFGVGSRTDDSRRRVYAHRFAWEVTNGPIPNRLFVCHTCDNPPCVNPNHMFLDTLHGNMKDAAAKGRTRNQNTDVTHCKNGHEFTEETTYVNPRGSRICRICMNLASCLRERDVRKHKRADQKRTINQNTQCDECDFISTAQGIGHHQTSFGHTGKTTLGSLTD
jgi:hypothetical protein